jgi:hypothetical protein
MASLLAYFLDKNDFTQGMTEPRAASHFLSQCFDSWDWSLHLSPGQPFMVVAIPWMAPLRRLSRWLAAHEKNGEVRHS